MSLRSKLLKVGMPILAAALFAASIKAYPWVSAPKPLPDIAIEKLSYGEGEWINGYKGSITGVIANLGDAPTGPFEVTASGLEGKITVDGGIEPGKTVPLEFYVNLPQGEYSIVVNADPDKKVSEKDEYNNQLSIDTLPVFEFISNIASAEQNKVYHDNALEDYRKVLDVYGINEKDARMVIGVGEKGYGTNFYFEGRRGVGGEAGLDNFTTDRRGMRHSVGHAINDTLFPTYHTWFDEGLSMYASGEIDMTHPALEDVLSQIRENPHAYWESQTVYYGPDSSNTPTHLIGAIFFYLMTSDYNLTPDNSRGALEYLTQTYTQTGQEMSRINIQQSYETALGVSLKPLFEIIGDGVKTLYGLYPPAEWNTKVMNEF